MHNVSESGRVRITSAATGIFIERIKENIEMWHGYPMQTQKKTYENYKPTKLLFKVLNESHASINLTISYAKALPRIYAKHAVIAQLNENNEWVLLDTSIDHQEQTLSTTSNRVGVFCVFVNTYWYSSYTQEIANEFPTWTRIQQTPESLGQRFFNFLGLHLEEVKEYLTWIAEQKYIDTIDLHVLDWVYLYEAGNIDRHNNVRVLANLNHQKVALKEKPTIRSFFYNEEDEGVIIDYQKKRIYSTVEYPLLYIESDDGEIGATPTAHHMWNAIDEFGLLVGLRRRYLEANKEMKERILDVFRYPSNTSDEGLTNGIARELNLINHDLIWKDDSKAFVLENHTGSYIDPRSIRLNGQRIAEDFYEITEENDLIIHPLNTGNTYTVSFIQGVKKFELHDKKNVELQKMMYQNNGMATTKLKNWVEYIHQISPIMWDHFRWDQGFWDTIDIKSTGLGFLPNQWDSTFDKWKGVNLHDL